MGDAVLSQAGDYGEARSEPWTYSRNSLPTMVYSTRSMIKCGSGAKGGKPKKDRVKARRKKNYFKIEDAARIISKLQPAAEDDGSTWSKKVIRILREATITMLERILFFLPSGIVEELYEFCVDVLDKFFMKADRQDNTTRIYARGIIMKVADAADIKVSFPK